MTETIFVFVKLKLNNFVSFHIDPPDVSITWDKNTNTLKCNAAGNPNAYIFLPWRHNVGSKVVRPALSDVSVQQGSSSLTLKGASPYMETGSYMCSVSNNISDYRGNTIQTKEMQVTVSGNQC